MRSIQTAALLAALGFSTLVMPGCLVNSSSKTHQSGTFVGKGTLEQIEPGRSTESFVVALLGQPTTRKDLGDGTELMRWVHTRRRTSSGGVFLLVASHNESETNTTTYVLLRDSIVDRVWQD
jgi:hypothetical protein